MSDTEYFPCPEWAEKLADLHAHNLSLPNQAALEAHLATCQACAAVLLEYQKMDELIHQVLSVKPPPSFTPELLWAREATPQKRRQQQELERITIVPGSLQLRDGELFPAVSHRTGWISRLVTQIAALLVIVLLLGSFLLLLQFRTPPTETHPTLAPPVGPVGKPITVHTQAGGLDATVRVTSGPYFLSEMLEVDLSITNHSHDTLDILPLYQQPCAPSFPSELPVMMTGGGRPSDTNLQHNLAAFGSERFRCSAGLTVEEFPPMQTISFSKDIVLTTSGHITLTAQTRFAKQVPVPGQNNGYRDLDISDPLAGHWPSLQINVQAGIPSDRSITGQQKGAQVTIDAPPLARSQLFYETQITCDSGSRGTRDKLTTMKLQQPDFNNYTHNNPASRCVWTYAVGAPGYAVFSGSRKYP